MKLTKNVIEKLELPATGQRLVWDSTLKGFGLRLTPTGRTYICQARVRGVTRRVTLGRHGIITLQQARQRAQRELSAMLDGRDPVAEKVRERSLAKTLRDVADEYLLAHRNLKPTSVADINRHADRSFETWRDRPVTEITREQVAVRFREMSECSRSQANQAFRILRALLNYARAAYRPGNEPILRENPVDILSQTKVWHRVNPKARRIPLDKIGVAWNLLQSLRDDPAQTPTSRTSVDIVCFLLLTGCRWNEAATLTWGQVDIEGRLWHLPDPKSRRPITFPLSDVAAKILADRDHTGNFVFPSRGETGHITSARGLMRKISEVIGAPVSPHDLRRTFRAVAAECRVELWRTKLLMGHRVSGDVTINSYTETSDLRYLKPEADIVANWIQQQAVIVLSEKVISLNAPIG